MEPTKFEGCNFTYTAPDDMKECIDLHVRKQVVDGFPCSISKWKPTLEEVAALANGSHLTLMIYGGSHPPVSLFVQVVPTDQGTA